MKAQGKKQFQNYDRIEMDGKAVWLPKPAVIPESSLVGREQEIEKTLAKHSFQVHKLM